LMVRLVGTRNYQIKSFHVPVTASRAEIMADFVVGIFDAAGGSSMPPGGYPHGTVTGIDAQLGWVPGMKN
jgi:hypothetical protein